MANGTITMEVALKALGIGWGDEVIIPALTFAATAYAPIAAGALPASWTSDRDVVHRPRPGRSRDHARTRIMPVHLGHQMADMTGYGDRH
jgi:dTDP-4-amino-4,6-dideoxygalactose transaminase